MPGQNRNEPFVLKHRLTGAAILIAFAVIVLPLLLGVPDSDNQGPAGPGDDTDTTVFHSSITPIGGATPAARMRKDGAAGKGEESAAGSTEKEAPEAAVATDSGSQPRSGEVASAADASAQAQSKPPPAEQSSSDAGQSGEQAKAKTVDRGWIVQVGVFKNPDNVKKLVAKLAKGGIDSSTQAAKTSEGDATRVFVGPFETRVEAARTKVRVKQRTGTEGLIVAYP